MKINVIRTASMTFKFQTLLVALDDFVEAIFILWPQ